MKSSSSPIYSKRDYKDSQKKNLGRLSQIPSMLLDGMKERFYVDYVILCLAYLIIHYSNIVFLFVVKKTS